jgi:hypothetical protein
MQLESVGWCVPQLLMRLDASGLDAVASAQLTGVQRAANKLGRTGARANAASESQTCSGTAVASDQGRLRLAPGALHSAAEASSLEAQTPHAHSGDLWSRLLTIVGGVRESR